MRPARHSAFVFLAAAALAGAGCQKAEAPYSPAALAAYRVQKDAAMERNPDSPFNSPVKVPFAPLKYYPVDASWIYQSKLERLATPQPVTILDTKGQQRKGALFGHFTFQRDGRTFPLAVYRIEAGPPGAFDYAVWFTDRTTGSETYEIGRYLDITYTFDSNTVYTLDFNRAYNPYCAYSPAYSCPIPRKEDHLDLAITVGEKKWH